MSPKFDPAAFRFPEKAGQMIDNLIEYKFVDARTYDPSAFSKNRKSLHHETRAAEGSFYVVVFRPPSAESQKLVVTLREGKDKTKNVLFTHTEDHIAPKGRRVASKSPGPSRSPIRRSVSNKHLKAASQEKLKMGATMPVNGSSKRKLLGDTAPKSAYNQKLERESPERMPDGTLSVFDRLYPRHPVKPRSKSPAHQQPGAPKDYYIGHPDVFKELIYRVEGKPVAPKTVAFAAHPQYHPKAPPSFGHHNATQ